MEKYQQLDLARGLAALFVFLNHLRYIVFVGFYGQELTLPGKIFYFFTGFGHECVIIFFVLSGFFITKSITDNFRNNNWSVKHYVIQRLSRLWLVLIPALLLTFSLDRMAWEHFYSTAGINRSSLGNFIQNLFFLQNITGPTFGSNLSLWSLCNEFWYYVLLPFILFPFLTKGNTMRKLFIGFAVVSAGFVLLHHIFIGIPGFFIFLLGTAVQRLVTMNNKKDLPASFHAIGLLQLLGILVAIRFGKFYYVVNDGLLGLSFAVFVFLTLKSKGAIWSKAESIAHFLSSFSYTLYLVHVPLILFFCSILQLSNELLNASNILQYCLLAIAILVVARVFYWLFEKNTGWVRHYLEKKL